MGPQKFTAANSAEALKMVREKMGSDAMILSSKDVDEGVEIVAISPDALAHLASQKNPFLSKAQSSSVNVPLNTPVFEEITKEVTDNRKDTVRRNVDHLKIMIGKDWFEAGCTEQQVTDINAAITAGTTYTA
jgi:flagellar biosynthesis GTPase FlhF